MVEKCFRELSFQGAHYFHSLFFLQHIVDILTVCLFEMFGYSVEYSKSLITK